MNKYFGFAIVAMAALITAPAMAQSNNDNEDSEQRVEVCHATGDGRHHTVEVSSDAVQAHVDHGDSLGECPDACPAPGTVDGGVADGGSDSGTVVDAGLPDTTSTGEGEGEGSEVSDAGFSFLIDVDGGPQLCSCHSPSTPPPPAEEPLDVKGSSFYSSCNNVGSSGSFVMMALLGLLLLLSKLGGRFRAKDMTALSLILFSFAGAAQAEGVDHFEPTAGANNYFVTDDATVLPHLGTSGWVIVDWAHDPLVLRDHKSLARSKIIDNSVSGFAGGTIGLFDVFELGVGVPVSYLHGPNINSFGLGDPRVQAKFKLLDSEGFNLGLKLKAELPLSLATSSTAQFLGDGLPTATPSLLIGYHNDIFRVGGELGYTFRQDKKISGLPVGQTAIYSLGAELTMIPNSFLLTADVFGSASPNLKIVSATSVPLEGVLGVKYITGPWLFTGGVGTGLIADYGAPNFRLFAGVGWLFPEKEQPIRREPVAEVPVKVVQATPPIPAMKDKPSLARLTENDDEIVILQPLMFEYDSAILKDESYSVLNDVVRIIRSHPGIKHLTVSGYASSEGTSAYNLALSQKRSQTVVDYMMAMGVANARMTAVGYGEENPIASNDTSEGRERNRRVEFHIDQKEGE